MRWIWQYDSPIFKFGFDNHLNPYDEIFFKSKYEISVNPMIRFNDIFGLNSKNNEDSIVDFLVDYPYICNIVFHYLAKLDLFSGLSYSEMIRHLMIEEIKNGVYGERVKELFFDNCINDNERSVILDSMYSYYMNDEKEYMLPKVFLKLFRKKDDDFEYAILPKGYLDGKENETSFSEEKGELSITLGYPFVFDKEADIYYDGYKDKYYYYCGDIPKNEKKFELIWLIFGNVYENIEDIWGKCFGVLGEEKQYLASYPRIGDIIMIDVEKSDKKWK